MIVFGASDWSAKNCHRTTGSSGRRTAAAEPGYTVKDGKAAMGNYNHFLTVQELIDLVAFLKQGATTPAK